MLSNVIAGLITAALLAAGGLAWRHRRHLGLLRATLFPLGRLRVSMAVLLRVKEDDCYVLVHHPFRPDSFGPLGGVAKYHAGAREALDAVGFVEQRPAGRGLTMAHDLRGFVPARYGIAFFRWYESGADRESGPDCLRRELREELAEAGIPEPVGSTDQLRFQRVRGVVDGPRPTPGKQYRTVRSFEVYDVIVDTPEAARLLRRLVELGRDPAVSAIILVSTTDIEEGRCGRHLISPQSAFLLGDRRIHEDLPALR